MDWDALRADPVVICLDVSDVLTDSSLYHRFWLLLPPSWHAHVTRKHDHKDRCLSLSSKVLQLAVCSICTGIAIPDLQFEYGLHGKPALLSKEIEFNTSKCGRYVAIIVSKKNPVGIDIASVSFADSVELFQPIFSFEEWQALQSSQDQQRLFTKYWSMKEAYIKFTGQGLSQSLASIDLGRVETTTTAAAATFRAVLDGFLIYFHSWWIEPDVILSACTTTYSAPVALLQITPSTLLDQLNQACI